MIVYTALFGDVTRDRLQPPPPGCDAQYVCFTDALVTCPGWRFERVSSEGRSPAFLARLFKMRPDRWFGPHASTIWIDASCALRKPADEIARQVQYEVAGLKHPDRSTVEQEAAEIIRLGLVAPGVVIDQLRRYIDAGFDTHADGLTTTGFLFRRPEAREFNELWEAQIIRHHLRDQLSVDFCAWKTGTYIQHLPGHYRDNAFMRYRQHARAAA